MNLLDLPLELILQIFSELSPSSILTCERINKYCNNLIRGSVLLQYALTLDTATAEDNPCSTVSVSSKLNQLRTSEEAWAHTRTDFIKNVPVTYHQSGVYDLSAGVYLLSHVSRTTLYTMNLPSTEEDEIEWRPIKTEKFIIDIGLCLYEHDLIAIVTTARHPVPMGILQTYDIEIELREFSTDKPHPQAEKSTFYVMNSLYEKPGIGIEIVGKHLVLVLSFINAERPQDRIFIFEWKKGVMKASFEARHRSYSGLLFLDEELLLLPNANTSTLDIFRIPSTSTLESPKPLLQLALPRLSDERFLGVISCRAEPNPISPSSYPEMKRRAAARAEAKANGSPSDSYGQRAWLATAEDALCLFELRILVLQLVMLPGGALNMNFQFRHRFTFVVHRRALLDIVWRFEERIRVEKENEKREREGEEKEMREVVSDDEMQNEMVLDGATTPPDLDPAPTAVYPTDIPNNPNLNPDNPDLPVSSDPDITIPWVKWGTHITRWFNSDNFTTHWITTTAGQRLVRMASSTAAAPTSHFVVLDFNKKRIKKARRLFEKRPQRDDAGMQPSGGSIPPYHSGAWPEWANVAEETSLFAHMDGVDDNNEGEEAAHAAHAAHEKDDENDDDSDDDRHSWQTAPEIAANANASTSTSSPRPIIASASATSSSARPPTPTSAPSPVDSSPPSLMSVSDSSSSSAPEQQDIQSDHGSSDWTDSEESHHGQWAPMMDYDIPGADDELDFDGMDEDDFENGEGAIVDWDDLSSGDIWFAPAQEQFDPSGIFAEPLISCLPYVARVSHGKYNYDGVMLDEERVIGTTTNFSTERIDRIEVHHFG